MLTTAGEKPGGEFGETVRRGTGRDQRRRRDGGGKHGNTKGGLHARTALAEGRSARNGEARSWFGSEWGGMAALAKQK